MNTIKKLGFGLMRLPMCGQDIDVEQVKQMVDRLLQQGFTYFDTAYVYLDGRSEEIAREVLVDRYPREQFQLATKLPAWADVTSEEMAKEMFWTSLRRTGAGYFDFYLMHNMGGKRSQLFEEFHLWEFIGDLKRQGYIRHIGFSFHGTAEELEDILNKHPEAEFVQLQINYADWESPRVQSRLCYEVARKHQKPIIIMEPVRGGALAEPMPEIVDLFRSADPTASPASWALRFAASLDGVMTVLSGMSNLEQVEDNLRTMGDFRPLSREEYGVIQKAQELLDSVPQIPCTKCGYCVAGCPGDIPIPKIFDLQNEYLRYQFAPAVQWRYEELQQKASACVACGQCEQVCPQRIAVIKELQKAHAVLQK